MIGFIKRLNIIAFVLLYALSIVLFVVGCTETYQAIIKRNEYREYMDKVDDDHLFLTDGKGVILASHKQHKAYIGLSLPYWIATQEDINEQYNRLSLNGAQWLILALLLPLVYILLINGVLRWLLTGRFRLGF